MADGRSAFSWDAVIKLGGSLHTSPKLRKLLDLLASEAKRRRLLIVPGGGPFANSVRKSWVRLHLSENGAHRMALLAMDQYGLLLCDLEPRAVAVKTLQEGRRVARGGKLPVLLVSGMSAAAPDLPASWSVTSDSVAAWVAARSRARRLILLKSVQVEPSSGAVSARQLTSAGILDRAFSRIATSTIPTWIANGRRPREIGRLLAGDQGAGVQIRLTADRRGLQATPPKILDLPRTS